MKATAFPRRFTTRPSRCSSERGVVEVIGLCGYYTMVSMTLNTFEFGLPDGEVSELA